MQKALAKGEEDTVDGPEAAATPQACTALPDGEKAEAAEGMTEEDQDQAAAQACGRPVPPVRQRDRLDTLKSEFVSAKLADFGNGVLANKKVSDDIQSHGPTVAARSDSPNGSPK